MADMTYTVTIRGTKAGNTFTWSRTGTIADIDHASHHVNGSQATLTNIIGDPGTGVIAQATGIGTGVVISKSTAGINILQLVDNTLAVVAQFALVKDMPFVFHAGYDFNGAFNASNTATDNPDEDVDSVTLTTTGGTRRFAALFGLKAVS
jgi:hypothetical protein